MGTTMTAADSADLPPDILIEAPPRLDEPDSTDGLLTGLFPMLAGLASVAVFATMGSPSGLGGRALLTGGAFVLVSVGLVAAQLHRQHRRRRQTTYRARTSYLRHLDDVRERARDAASRQRAADRALYPEPQALPAIVEQGSHVCASPGSDPALLLVRYGVRRGTLAASLVVGARSPREDPVAAAAVDALLAVHRELPGLAAVVDLSGCRRVSVLGPMEEARALVRAMVCSGATFHAPTELRVAVLAHPETEQVWDWVKWLPHALSPLGTDAVGPIRMVAADPDQLVSLLPTSRDDSTPEHQPRLLLVVDGVGLGRDDPLLRRVEVVTMLVGSDHTDGAGSDLLLTVQHRTGRDGPNVRVEQTRAETSYAVADQCDLATATALARRLAGGPTDLVTVRGTELADLLDVPDLDSPTYTWRRRTGRERLRVPIGTASDGSVVALDLKEPAELGIGPHGLVVGATGSGKSELLRTAVLGLALTHSPEQLNLVLVDFKGGATFAALGDLPHVSAAITNLSHDLTLVDRMADALSGEVVRREEALGRAGRYASVRDYERARDGGAPLAPLPSLLVVVDELAELLSYRPDLVDLFVTIGRLGRSLAIHLLLATQRLEEGRLRGLESHLAYRIGLRTLSAAESRAVLGAPDAAALPAVPGQGLLRTSSTDLQRFTAAFVSGPRRLVGPTPAAPTATGPLVLPWTAGPVGVVSMRNVVPPPAGGAKAGRRSFLDYAVERLSASTQRAHRIWLPPLDRPPTLDELMPDLGPRPGLGLVSPAWRSTPGITVPVGVLDLPREQRQDTLSVDLDRGHVAVVGGPRSGRTTLLRTLALGVALTRTPRECELYVLDLAGGLGTALEGLPHLAGVATSAEPDVVRRVVAEVRGILDDREEYFRSHGIDTMDSYRRRRSAEGVEDGHGDVALVVDGWGSLRDVDDDDLDVDLQRVLSRGPRLGVHLLVASARWADLRPAVRDLMSTRLELRLGDPLDSEVDRRAAAAVPAHRPGRGLSPDGVHFLGALPRIDGKTDPRTAGTALVSLVGRVAAAWPGPAAPRVQLLPSLVTIDDLVAGAATTRPGLLLMALDEQGLVPVGLDVEAEPGWLVFGDGGSGRSSALRTYLHEVVRTRAPATAQVVVVDPRRSLLGEVPDAYLVDHLASTGRAGAALADVARRLEARLPGPGVTAGELRNRTWWSGPDVFVVADDDDLLASAQGSPLAPLLPLLPLAREIGLHLVIARRAAGASRTSYEPVLQRLRDLGAPGLLLSGDPGEGPLLGRVRPVPAPPGRGRWVTRERVPHVVQVAWCPPPS